MSAARWALPVHEPHMSKLDLAESAGFDPGEDHGGQPVDPDAPLSPRLVRWIHQGSETGCEECGVRCDFCNDRTCLLWGPEPEPTCGAHTVCVECAVDNHCPECKRAREIERAAG